jgi:signal transduction histidine kinase
MTDLGGDNPQDHRSLNVTPMRRLALRWRWYHFYFLLALFDVVVIIVSISLYHSTLTSYAVALEDLRHSDDAQRWVANLSVAVIELNAPGNDVFASRRVAEERERFERTQTRFAALLKRQREFGVDLGDFERQVGDMFREEHRVFNIFAEIEVTHATGDLERDQVNTAAAFMASMDRYQANAQASLATMADTLSEDQHRLLHDYGAALKRKLSVEKYLLGIVVLILIGVFWYGRKLQGMHDQMLQEQQRAIEEKHARLAAVGEVCSAVAHGMRNPLAAITSSAQLVLEYGTLDEPTTLRVRDVLNESRRLDHRIRRLLDFSRARERVLEDCDIELIVRDAINEIQPKLDECQVATETECTNGPLVVRGDREWLAQAIIEVVSNSMEHLPPGGLIRVTCKPDPQTAGHTRINVVDDGPGIPESIRERVFDLFFTSKAEGNGIGLATVKRVIDMHGGRVAVEPPIDGTGANICIVLPATGGC